MVELRHRAVHHFLQDVLDGERRLCDIFDLQLRLLLSFEFRDVDFLVPNVDREQPWVSDGHVVQFDDEVLEFFLLVFTANCEELEQFVLGCGSLVLFR